MKTKGFLKNVMSCVGFGLILSACGDASIGDRVTVSLDAEEQVAQLDVEMSNGLEISMVGEYPIADGKGSLTFVPATKEENAKIRVKLYIATLIDDELDDLDFGIVNTLPNGAPFPVAMTPPLYRVRVAENDSVEADAVFNISPELQLGAMIGIQQFNSQYVPDGVSVCQNFRNDQNIAFGAICFYGGNGTQRGGIFVGGNLGEVIDVDNLVASDDSSVAITTASTALVSMDDDVGQTNIDLGLPSLTLDSGSWDDSKHDPRRRLRGRRALKTYRNVMRVLSR